MNDNLLLTSLWLLPLIGLAAVLMVPKRSESAVKWVALGFTSATFLASLLMLQVYLAGDRAPLEERAAHNRSSATWSASASIGSGSKVSASGPRGRSRPTIATCTRRRTGASSSRCARSRFARRGRLANGEGVRTIQGKRHYGNGVSRR